MKNNKKVAILTNMVTPYRVPFFSELAKQVKCLDILTCVEREIDREWDVENAQSYSVIQLAGLTLNLNKGTDAKRILHFRFGIVWYLLRNRPDLLIIGDASWTSFIAGFACKLLMIDYFVWNEITTTSKVSGGIVDKFRRWLYQGSKKCIASCMMAEDYLISRGVEKKKIKIINNAVDNDYFLAQKEKLAPLRDKLREQFGIDQDTYTFIYVGQLISRKRVVETVEAIAKLAERQKVHLLVAGAGPLEDAMRSKAQSHNFSNITFCGFANSETLCELYTASDALVLLSEDEPWGMVVNEAILFKINFYCTNEVAAAVEFNKKFGIGVLYDFNSEFEIVKLESKLDFNIFFSPKEMAVLFISEVYGKN
ncbi:glycosyltransferase [Vibrio cholerae]|nr:putative glycosyltransferase [Vibrio cholerae]GIB53089.1 glycosyltransferase [Vibrio cholerae]